MRMPGLTAVSLAWLACLASLLLGGCHDRGPNVGDAERPAGSVAGPATTTHAGEHTTSILTGMQMGTWVLGPHLRGDELTGRVVLIDFWGRHCPVCLAGITHVASLQRQHPRPDLVVIADHLQDGTPSAIAATWLSHGGDTGVTVLADATVAHIHVTELPRCLVIDRQGTLVYDGDPAGVQAAVQAALERPIAQR